MRSIFKFPIISHYRSAYSLMYERHFGTILFFRARFHIIGTDVHNILSTRSQRYSRNLSSNNIFVLLPFFFLILCEHKGRRREFTNYASFIQREINSTRNGTRKCSGAALEFFHCVSGTVGEQFQLFYANVAIP